MHTRNIYSLSDQKLQDMPEQGSDAWLSLRKGKVTGSKPGDLFFNFNKESDWDEILAKWSGDVKEEFDDISKARMAWGSKHEDTAVEVIVDHIPNSHFFECPLIPMNEAYAASPDGAIVVLKDDGSPDWHANVEIKCPGRYVKSKLQTPEEMKTYLKKKWRTPASYYMVQIHMEMAAQNAAETLFVVWTPLMTRMWRIPFDRSYWELCLDVLENFRNKSVPFDVMLAKVQKLKRHSYGPAKQPLWKEVHTPPI